MSSSAPLEAWALPPSLATPAPDPSRLAGSEDPPLAWLPPETHFVEGLLGHLAAAGSNLRDVPVADVAEVLGRVGARFADPDDPLRNRALGLLPEHARISPAQARHVLDGMARDWTAERLGAALEADLGDARVLDRFVEVGVPVAGAGPGGGGGADGSGTHPGGAEPRGSGTRRLRAMGPGLAIHVCAGTVPGVAVTSLIRGLLVKGPVLLKPGAGDAVLPVLFGRALAEAGPVGRILADASAVVYWPGGEEAWETPALARAALAVVYGSDETVATLRGRLAPSATLVAYPHRLSVAVVEGRAAPTWPPATLAGDLARAVATFDQRGCVSPQQVFVVGGAADAAVRLGQALARALDELGVELPPGRPDPATASAIHQLRGTAELRAGADERVRLHRGAGVSWTVIVDPEPAVRPSCLGRTVHVTPLPDVQALVRVLEPVARFLQTVGLHGWRDQERGGERSDRAGEAGEAGGATDVAETLGRLGASRIAPLAEVPFPPAWWLHDGRGPLRSLVRWVEWSG